MTATIDTIAARTRSWRRAASRSGSGVVAVTTIPAAAGDQPTQGRLSGAVRTGQAGPADDERAVGPGEGDIGEHDGRGESRCHEAPLGGCADGGVRGYDDVSARWVRWERRRSASWRDLVERSAGSPDTTSGADRFFDPTWPLGRGRGGGVPGATEPGRPRANRTSPQWPSRSPVAPHGTGLSQPVGVTSFEGDEGGPSPAVVTVITTNR